MLGSAVRDYGGPQGGSAKLPLSAKTRNATPGQRPPKAASMDVRLSKTAAFCPW
jgi:hypothetical protein